MDTVHDSSVPFGLGFKLEPAQDNQNWQTDVERIYDLIRDAYQIPEHRRRYPRQISILGRHSIPGRYTGLLSAYVDLAAIAISDEGVVELKIWERQWQIWSGAKWVWRT
jgi:hypothetical protein